MDEMLRQALDQVTEKSRSKLEPHADIIRELRRKGRTYDDIAQFFAERMNLKVAPSTIHAFVHVRARRRQRLHIELPPAEDKSPPSHLRSIRDDSEVRRRIDELKRRPPVEAEKPRFEYDEDEPLTLIPKVERKVERKEGTGSN